MVRLKVELDFKEFLRKLERARPLVRQAGRDVINECSLDLQREAKLRAPVNTGRLRADIQIEFFDDGLASETGNTVDYAPWVEFGSGPHGSSKGSADFIAGVTRWAKLVLGLDEDEVYPIIRKIRNKGTPAQPYLGPAWESVREKCEREIERVLIDAARIGLK